MILLLFIQMHLGVSGKPSTYHLTLKNLEIIGNGPILKLLTLFILIFKAITNIGLLELAT